MTFASSLCPLCPTEPHYHKYLAMLQENSTPFCNQYRMNLRSNFFLFCLLHKELPDNTCSVANITYFDLV